MDDNKDLRLIWHNPWFAIFLRGMVALIFGAKLAFLSTVAYLPWYVLAFMFATGLAILVGTFTNGRVNGATNTLYLQGGFSLITAIIVALFSFTIGNANRDLLLIFGIFFLVNGVLDLIFSINARSRGQGLFFITLNGIITGFLGLVFVINYFRLTNVTLRANYLPIGYVSLASAVLLTVAALAMLNQNRINTKGSLA